MPITLRSMATVGTPFSGTLTGGNARMPFYGQELPYQFMVSGTPADLDATVHMSSPGYQVFAFLVDPSGTPVDVQSSMLWDGSGTNLQDISLFRQNPAPGVWSLLVVQVNNVDSVLTGAPFTADITDNSVSGSAHGLPNNTSTVIHAAHPATATIKVTNTGTQPEGYMVDARTSQQSLIPLAALFASPSNEPLPITDFSKVPQLLVPPFSPTAQIAAQSTVPITLDTSPEFGTPDVEGVSSGHASVATLNASELPASIYSCARAIQGPFAAPTSSTTFSCGGTAVTNGFAADVSTSAGNLWGDLETGTNTYNPLVLNPGQTGTITVQISPTASAGTHVSGFLALETFNFNDISSDELVTFPYAYTAG